MADGRAKPLAEIRAGDRIFGTTRQGRHRRYIASPVLAHWSSVKTAYRVTLEDGTELVAAATTDSSPNGGGSTSPMLPEVSAHT